MRRRFPSRGASRSGVALLLSLSLGLSSTVARAEDAESARLRIFREQYERAGRAYQDHDYAAAVPALQAAFAIEPVPQILFNIAQAYRRLGKWNSARIYFELYRSISGSLSAEHSAQVEKLILEVTEAERAAAAKTLVVERTRLVYVQSEKPLPKWLRPLGITSSLVGLGLVASGATLLGLDGRCQNAAEPPALECDRLYNSKTPGTVLTVVGAGVFLVGAVTFGLSLRKPVKPVVRETPPPENPELPALPGLPSAPQAPSVPTSTPTRDDNGEPPPAGWNAAGTRIETPRSGP